MLLFMILLYVFRAFSGRLEKERESRFKLTNERNDLKTMATWYKCL